MDNSKKSAGGGFVTFVMVAGVAAYAGSKVWKVVKPEHKGASVEAGTASSHLSRTIAQASGPDDPMGKCLNALGNCAVVNPCPAVQAKSLLQRRRMGVDAEDTVHATMLEVCEKATYLQSQTDWTRALMARARWRQNTFYKRSTRTCSLDEARYVPVNADDVLRSDAADRRLKAALCRLEVRDRCVIEARYFESKDDATIQVQCGMTSAAMVRKQLQRARERLKVEMGRTLLGGGPVPPASQDDGEPLRRALGERPVPRYGNRPTARFEVQDPTPSPPAYRGGRYEPNDDDD